MTLTLGPAPLGSNPSGHFNFSLDEAPRHRILFEGFPRRMRAFVGDRHVLDSTRGMLLHESNIKPVYYAPIEDFADDVLVASDHTTHCPFKGDASYWSLKVGDRVIENAVWHYPEPVAESPWLEGYAALFWDKADLWLQEDEPVHGYFRDPYHRVDVMESSRRVKVRVKGHEVADSDRPKMLFETGLPPRPYLLRVGHPAGDPGAVGHEDVVPVQGRGHLLARAHARRPGRGRGVELRDAAARDRQGHRAPELRRRRRGDRGLLAAASPASA